MSKYAAITEYLRKSTNDKETLSYKDIERILGEELPATAYKHRAFWANTGRVASQTWISAGWKAGALKLGDSITFQRVKEAGAPKERPHLSIRGRSKRPPAAPKWEITSAPQKIKAKPFTPGIVPPVTTHHKVGIHPEAVNVPQIIRELHQLMREGILTEEEFKAKKEELLKAI